MSRHTCWQGPAVMAAIAILAVRSVAPAAEPPQRAAQARLPEGVPPALGCWFWTEKDFAPGGFRPYVDMVARRSAFNLLTASLRVARRELSDREVHDQIREATAYARSRGVKVAMDLDVRLDREAFRRAHPDELQEMLRLREVELKPGGEASLRIEPDKPNDHYTSATTPYVCVGGRLLRVYRYRLGDDGLTEPQSVTHITGRCTVREAGEKGVEVRIACGPEDRGFRACVMAAFRHLAADVFAPHLLEYQESLLRRYADCGLAGACKDEWGFPPCFDGNPKHDDVWYSEAMRAAYAAHTGGRDLVRDALLMFRDERGRTAERQKAINHLVDLTWRRNAAIEADFYRAAKSAFGASTFVATHPTWWPNPDVREFKKNGLDWWAAPRDWAQTDEVTPFAVCTALTKKWGSPLWYNMFYATTIADYESSLWTHAMAGGRINYHPLYPSPGPIDDNMAKLLGGGLARGEARVRLLNFIAKSPIDCPIAVVFGHACATNWAGPGYDDVGLSLADACWRAGYPADLIPSSEIGGALQVADDGAVRYGAQRYAAVVLYHPEFEGPGTAAFFRRAEQGPTTLIRVGDWTRTSEGEPVGPGESLPSRMATAPDVATAATRVIEALRSAGVRPQTPATGSVGWPGRLSAAPARSGHCRLIDGTEIELAGTRDVSGDPITTTFEATGRPVTFDAVGVAAIRLSKDGAVEAVAAGGLKRLRAGAWDWELDRRVDVALWRDAGGAYHGAIQDEGPVPAPLAAVTSDWLRLAVPSSGPHDRDQVGHAGDSR